MQWKPTLFVFLLVGLLANVQAQCPAPTGFQVVRNWGDSVLVAWNPTPNAVSYFIEYGNLGFVLGSGVWASAVQDTFFVVKGLVNYQHNDIYVGASCSPTGNSLRTKIQFSRNYTQSIRAPHAVTNCFKLQLMPSFFGLDSNITTSGLGCDPNNKEFLRIKTNTQFGFLQTLRTEIDSQDFFVVWIKGQDIPLGVGNQISFDAITPSGAVLLHTMNVPQNTEQLVSIPVGHLVNPADNLHWVSIRMQVNLDTVITGNEVVGFSNHAFVDSLTSFCSPPQALSVYSSQLTHVAQVIPSGNVYQVDLYLNGDTTVAPFLTKIQGADSTSVYFTNIPMGPHLFKAQKVCNQFFLSPAIGPVPVGFTGGIISGALYYTDDSACSVLPFQGVPYKSVKVQPGPTYIYSNQFGYFFKPVPTNNYSLVFDHFLSPTDFLPVFNTPCSEDSIEYVDFLVNGLKFPGFANDAMVDFSGDELPLGSWQNSINIMSAVAAKPLSIGNYFLKYRFTPNIPHFSTAVQSSQGWFEDTVSISSVANTLFPYSIGTNLPFGLIPIGDSVFLEIEMTPLVQDSIVFNNSFQTYLQIVGPYDPNDKVPNPRVSQVPIDEIFYTIRFQNTGNSAAAKVTLVDTLPAELDPSTIQLFDGTHPYFFSRTGSVLTWDFYGINLPPSSVDDKGSIGAIRFSIRPHAALLPGDSVRNKAEIYFDLNPPIITPWAVSKVVAPANPAGIIQPKDNVLRVYPNPTRQVLHVELAADEDLQVVDLSGRVLMRQAGVQGRNTLPVHSLRPGTYLLVTGSGAVFKWILSE